MSGLQAFTPDELAKLAAQASPYHEIFRREGMSVGLYVLPAGSDDTQYPHDTDELYVVLAGSAVLRSGGTDHPALPGSVLSVDQGKEHQFVDITEDLRLLVVFAPPGHPE